MSEQQMIDLVRRARAGDRQAFGELVVQFEPTVFSIVLARLRNRSEAREATQDVFVQAMRKLSQVREPERFAGWLRQIAVRMSINRLVRRPNEIVRSPESFGGVQAQPDSPLENLLKSEQAGQLHKGLGRLRELDRRTLVAFYLEGQSLKQMSEAFDSPIGTIKRRLHTARNRLRDELVNMQPA
ncbi:MAG: RNA polymerase sigma factor [Planctomycetaceae bacterium]